MIRAFAAVTFAAVLALTGCSDEKAPVMHVIKTVHPDGTATCVLDTGDPHSNVDISCEATQWKTSTVTATPTQ